MLTPCKTQRLRELYVFGRVGAHRPVSKTREGDRMSSKGAITVMFETNAGQACIRVYQRICERVRRTLVVILGLRKRQAGNVRWPPRDVLLLIVRDDVWKTRADPALWWKEPSPSFTVAQ